MVRVLVVMGVAFFTMSAATAQLPLAKAQVTESLFQEYIANPYRIETDQVRAAVVLVASRGLDDPEIVDRVLQEFEKACKERDGRSKVKIRTLAVLSEMMEISGRRRNARNQLGGMWIPPDESPHEVEILRKLIMHGREADTHDMDEFVMAVRNAQHPEGQQFLLDVLSTSESNSSKFLSAVGLAELGNPIGFEWLLDKADTEDPDYRKNLFFTRTSGWHFYAQSSRLGDHCIKSLADLAQMNSSDVDNVAPIKDWWQMHKEHFTGGKVHLLFEPGGSLN